MIIAFLVGLLDRGIESDKPVTAKYRIEFVITYADCSIVKASQLQSEIALSTTKVEYLA